jgi:hypothetical protein
VGEAAKGASQGYHLVDGSQGRPGGEEGLCLGASQVGLHVTRFFLLKGQSHEIDFKNFYKKLQNYASGSDAAVF